MAAAKVGGGGSGGGYEGTSSLLEQGYLLRINTEEIERINLRVLSSSHVAGLGEETRTQLFVSAELTFELLLFRKIFQALRDQLNLKDFEAGADESLPIEVFQRAFERLFYVLRDHEGFSAKVYDENRNGWVGWGEFCHVFKRRRVGIRLSISERIYLTFDNQDSCHAGQVISWVILLTIIVSSVSFILSTVPEYQVHLADGSAPVPHERFKTIEHSCLALFVCEYLVRFCTCWSVRAEVFDQKQLLEIVTGHDVIRLPNPLERLLQFILAPSNLVDLAAILPGVLGLLMPINGGGFVVLRLIRLTRIFRALKQIRGPAIVLARTIQSSLKAFFVLAFNLLLVIVISGSLMYLAEGGKWDTETRTFLRTAGRFWNETSLVWEDKTAESPFLSIPHAFWWAIVTAATVGYGDVVPTTSLGYAIAVATMVTSIVILALPVGVIGGSFSQNWANYDKDESSSVQIKAREMAAITSSIQKIDPMLMSTLMLVEVWNDRFPEQSLQAWGPSFELQSMPYSAEFMGQAAIELELPENTPVTKILKLDLQEDVALVRRPVTGTIHIKYEWTPASPDQAAMAVSGTSSCEDLATESSTVIRPILGNLRVTLLSAEKLINLDLHSLSSASNPYCTVLCYPNSPDVLGEVLEPQVWRCPTVRNSLHPQWNSCYNFEYNWVRPRAKRERPRPSPKAQNFESKFDEALSMLQKLGPEVKTMKDRLGSLTARVDRLCEGLPPDTRP
eukprot:TRINITY_DN111918_c0_g1_i1.p1 TRINITY_DN111918_c0_g1~~TRINITY_DN111918_c0_g1_i1.p1  ORF type:complete len:733 (-),score=115.06 TRINITY_DN111918_c0_g1_i1:143-2341(-)